MRLLRTGVFPGHTAQVSVSTVSPMVRQGAACLRGSITASERRLSRRTHCRTSSQVAAYEAWGRVGGSRFLQTDPILGGSANNYDYANQDPINQLDLDGNMALGDSGVAGCSFACTASSYAAFERSLKHKSHHWWSHPLATVRHAAVHAADATSFVGAGIGLCPVEACSIVSGALGATSAGLYAAGGHYSSAGRQLESTAFTVGTLGLGRSLKLEQALGRHVRQIKVLRGVTHVGGSIGGMSVCGGLSWGC